MNNKKWCITENTPEALILAPKALHEKIKYLRWVDSLLDSVSGSEPLTPIYRHNLYESWVVFFWSYLVSMTKETCDELEKRNPEIIARKDIKSCSSFNGVFKYLKLVYKEIFPSPSLEKKFHDYRVIRNLCAHEAGGRTETNISNGSILLEYGGGFQNVSDNESKSLRRLRGIYFNERTYNLTEEFCEGMCEFGVDYIYEFQCISDSIGERSKKLFRE